MAPAPESPPVPARGAPVAAPGAVPAVRCNTPPPVPRGQTPREVFTAGWDRSAAAGAGDRPGARRKFAAAVADGFRRVLRLTREGGPAKGKKANSNIYKG